MSVKEAVAKALGILFICSFICLLSVYSVHAGFEWRYDEDYDGVFCTSLDGGTGEAGWDDTYTCANTHDGNWSTYGKYKVIGGTDVAYVYINYTKPSYPDLNGSVTKWQVKDGVSTYNLTINESCWDQNPLQFQARSRMSTDVYWSCWNGTTFIDTKASATTDIYEEAIWWYYNKTGKWYNIRTFDEETEEQLTFNITFSNGTNSLNYNNQFDFFEYWEMLTQGENTLTFKNVSGGYSTRNYYLTVENGTLEYDLDMYLLKSASGSLINFIVVNNLGSGIPDALITVQKLMDSTWTTVAQGKTDSTGTVGIYLDSSITYKITALKTGYTPWTDTIMPTNPPYRITLRRSGIGTYETDWSWITYTIQPWHGLVAGTVENITFTIYSEMNDLDYFGMNLTFNGSVVFSQNDSVNPSGGAIMGNVDLTGVTQNSYVYVIAYFKKNDYPLQTMYKTYSVFVGTPGNYSVINIAPLVENDLPLFERSLLALIVTGFAIVAVAGVGMRGYGLGFIGLCILGMFTYLGWFYVEWIVMMGILSVGLYLWRG